MQAEVTLDAGYAPRAGHAFEVLTAATLDADLLNVILPATAS